MMTAQHRGSLPDWQTALSRNGADKKLCPKLLEAHAASREKE